jgi:hypothetical protein
MRRQKISQTAPYKKEGLGIKGNPSPPKALIGIKAPLREEKRGEAKPLMA